MRILRIILFAFLFFGAVSLPAQQFSMILATDPVLEDLRFLTLETGTPFLSFSPPLSSDEVKIYLDSINEADLSIPAREAYYRLLSRLNPSVNLSLTYGNFTGHFEVNITLEGRIRFNEEVLWHPLNQEISKLLVLPSQLFFSDNFQLYLEPHISMKPMDDNYDKTFFLNFPENITSEYYPIRSFAAIGGSWWNFQIGRDYLFWGTAHTGSLSFTGNDVLYDFAKLSVFSPKVKYTVLVNQMPLKLNSQLFTNDNRPANLSNSDDTMQRHFYLHRLDFSLFDKVSFSIMEGLLVSHSALEIRYLNPLMIFHSLFAWNDYSTWTGDPDSDVKGHSVGSFFSIEVNWNIFGSLAFYGQFVMNEFALPGELDHIPEQPPNALGYLAGLHYSHSFGEWGAVFFIEFIYTDPYLHILSSPFSSFIHMDYDKRYYFTGYGRDTVALTLGANFFKTDELSFSGSFAWIASGDLNRRNPVGLTWNYEISDGARNRTAPSGTAEHKFIFSVEGRWKAFSFLTLKSNFAGIYAINNEHKPANSQFGGQASISAIFHY